MGNPKDMIAPKEVINMGSGVQGGYGVSAMAPEQAANPTTMPPAGFHFTSSSTAHLAPNAVPVRSAEVEAAVEWLKKRENYVNPGALLDYIATLEQQSDTSGLREALETKKREAELQIRAIEDTGGGLSVPDYLYDQLEDAEQKLAAFPANPEGGVGK